MCTAGLTGTQVTAVRVHVLRRLWTRLESLAEDYFTYFKGAGGVEQMVPGRSF